MPGVTIRLHHRDLQRALDVIDLPDLVAQELTRRAAGAGERWLTGPLTTESVGPADAADLTAVDDAPNGRVCLLPTPSLQMISLAGLAGLAARRLLPPGLVTAAIFGSGSVARLHLGLIARYLPNVSHTAVYPAAALETERPHEWTVRDDLEVAGIALSIGSTSRHAALGATLLVVTELGWDRLDLGQLRPGVLVINAARRDLPDELLAQVDRVYVDDLGLLEHNQHRKFVRLHLAGSDQPAAQAHRRRPLWRYHQRIDNDLGRLLTGAHRRPGADEVLLVELLSGRSLIAWLAVHIYRAATALGLGWQVNEPETE